MKAQRMAVWFFAVFMLQLPAQTESSGALGLGINRYGIAFHFKHYSALKDIQNQSFRDWSIELGNVQHPRELALLNNVIGNSGIYKLDKINYLWVIRPAWSFRSVISPRPDRRSVGVSATASAGLPMAYHWPVYVTVMEVDAQGNEFYQTLPYNPSKHPQSAISGRASFTNGLSKGGFIPGVSLQTGLEFSWGNYRTDMNILGIGARVEAFSSKLPIMFNNQLNRSIVSTFYINFAFGLGN